MKIIAECGATKSDWRLVCDGTEIKQVLVSGINVSTTNWDAVKVVVDEALGQLCGALDAIESIHIYVAGVVTEEVEANFRDLFATYYPSAKVEIQIDKDTEEKEKQINKSTEEKIEIQTDDNMEKSTKDAIKEI